MKKYLYDRFGSKWGLVNYSKYYIQQRFGLYSQWCDIDWRRIQRLIFVCHGNICRSPLGEAYAAHHGARTESFGIHCKDGCPADPRAASYARDIGLDMSAHRSRNLSHLQPAPSDLVIVMEPAHLSAMTEIGKVAQVTLAGLWLPRPHPYLHDPYSASPRYFSHCEDRVVMATQAMLAKLGL